MRIQIVCPGSTRFRTGNRVTALRWARILRGLGHVATIHSAGARVGPCDLLVALHARHSASVVRDSRRRHPDRPIILALTGTDLYRDLPGSRSTRESMRLADRLIILQPLAARRIPLPQRHKARLVYQSVHPTTGAGSTSRRDFRVCIVGHLRSVKDPARAALAVRHLPAESRIRIVHAGAALTPAWEHWARQETGRNPRYRWLDQLPRWRARRRIASSSVLLLTSRMEGGAHVIGEAAVDGIPVIASRIPGSIGLLGKDYPGFFPCGNTLALRRLLLRAERDSDFLRILRRHCRALAPRFHPRRERRAWSRLLREVIAGRADIHLPKNPQ